MNFSNVIIVSFLVCLAISASTVTAGNKFEIDERQVQSEELGQKGIANILTLGLDTLSDEYQTFRLAVAEGKASTTSFSSKATMARVANNSVVIDAMATGDPQHLKRALEALGARVTAIAGRMVSARIPLARLPELESLGALKFARPAIASTRSGNVTSQGDMAQNSDMARLNQAVSGVGSNVGVLSDSFNCSENGSYQSDQVSGDLPAGINVLAEMTHTDPSECSDEGRAMAQIVHDVAPGAGMAFHTAFDGEADFAQGILDLADAGSTIIVDDVFYYAEPMFQDGVIAQAVDTVKSLGVPYFSSAGNSGRKAYQSVFVNSGIEGYFDGSVLHDFDPGPGVETRLEITQSGSGIFVLQWSDPFYSVSGPPGAASDLDLFIYGSPTAMTPLYGYSIEENVGADPLELIGLNGSGTLWVSIEKYQGNDPDQIKILMYGGVNIMDAFTGTNAGTISGHANAAGANAVGASAYFLTPEFGESPPVLNYYSSAGNTPILFDTAGNPISEIRQKPEFTAPDGGDNTFFGNDYEPNGWPNFFGTSAAAPHAAAVAALMREATPALTPPMITAALKYTAVDILQREIGEFSGPRVAIGTGFDNDSGAGLIDALEAVGTQECDHIVLENQIIGGPSEVTFEACRTITLGPKLALSPDSNVTLRAGEQIKFDAKFRVPAGGILRAGIDQSLAP